MDTPGPTGAETPAVWVPAGADRFGDQRSLDIRTVAFKLAAQDSRNLFVTENTRHAPGGPARHLHYDQDEWFYILEGVFLFEVGPDRMRLTPGDALLAPRRVPHAWAFVGPTQGRILVVFAPAGQMEAYYRAVTQAHALPAQDPAFWRAHGMELLGPPLALD